MAEKSFKTWRGVDHERTVPPSVRADFVPHEFVYPGYAIELNVATFRCLAHLVKQAMRGNDEPSDELLALHEMVQALDPDESRFS